METLSHLSALFAVLALGLMTGALLAEGAVLVPYWRSMPPESFLVWYKQHAALLQNFFGPVEIAAAVLVIAATVLNWIRNSTPDALFCAASVLAIAVLAVFPIYFQKVNHSFAAGTIALEQVAEELRRWSRWHWLRTAMSMAAFLLATVALIRTVNRAGLLG